MIDYKKGLKGQEVVFPLTKEQIDTLDLSGVVNPKVGDSHGLNPIDKDRLNEYLNEITEVRLMVSKGIYPYHFMDKYYPFKGEAPMQITVPLAMKGLSFDDPQGLAEVVHMDDPEDAPRACRDWLLNEGVSLKKIKGYIDFLGAIPDTNENISDGVKRALHEGFEAKWFFGCCRPETLFEYNTGIFGSLLTQYPEGCPKHPSYPAGHGCAVAGGVRRVIEMFDVNDVQKKVLLDTAYLWAMFRSLAGVHFAQDNVAGLVIGGLDKYFTKKAKEEYLI